MLVKTSTGILWPRLRKSTSFDFGAIPRISHWGPLISTSLFKFPSTVTVNPIRIPDTPIRKKRSGASVLVPGATKAQMEFARETHGYWVGPFPILDFLDTVLPSSTQYSTPLPTIFKDIPSNTQEKDMYPKLISALNSLNLENLQFINTSANADDKAPSYKKWKPDISIYSSEFHLDDRKDHHQTYSGTSKGSAPSQTHISDLLLHFELKKGNHDPFCDNPSGRDPQFESTANIGTQGQIAAILSDLLSYSFRTHAFAIFMDGHIARLLRADRAGILVSAAFNYRTHPQYLVQFLYRFNDATPGQRGIDTTVDLDHSDCAIQVPIDGHSAGHTVVTWKQGEDLPHTESLVGRGHRVLEVHGPKVPSGDRTYILKDGWRVNLSGVTPEWDIINELDKAGVPHIPKVWYGGTLEGGYHSTLADQYSESPWRVGPGMKLTPRKHYRLVEDNVGRPLAKFKNAQELTQVLVDVIEALKEAWERCHYLHRDVSSANIMITPSGNGVLIDWEFAKKIPSGSERGRAIDRTGTWRYISSALLRFPKKPHSPHDDLQSVLWVAFENALNHLDHVPTSILRFANALLEYDPETKEGGHLKAQTLSVPPFIEFKGNPAFSQLLYDFFEKMRLTDEWEARRFLPRPPGKTFEERPIPPDFPNHETILAMFRESLQSDEQWFEEEYKGPPQLLLAMERAERGNQPSSTSTHPTTSKRASSASQQSVEHQRSK